MATIPEAVLLAASSPYAKRGVLYHTYKRYYGKAGDVQVWQADTRTMNPTVPQRVIDQAYERDPESARAEYGAQFRADIDAFVSREAVEQCVVPGRIELPWIRGVSYSAFVDSSGGSQDSMTLAIGHRENGIGILDAVRERKPPFSPEAVVEEYADLLSAYRISRVTGDQYGGEWPRERFREHGIEYRVSERPKGEIYQALLPEINSAKVELLDHPRLVAQLTRLERRTARGRRDSIDHAPGGHDDLINAVAGVLARPPRQFRAGVWGR